jgi:hypothetical protein
VQSVLARCGIPVACALQGVQVGDLDVAEFVVLVDVDARPRLVPPQPPGSTPRTVKAQPKSWKIPVNVGQPSQTTSDRGRPGFGHPGQSKTSGQGSLFHPLGPVRLAVSISMFW